MNEVRCLLTPLSTVVQTTNRDLNSYEAMAAVLDLRSVSVAQKSCGLICNSIVALGKPRGLGIHASDMLTSRQRIGPRIYEPRTISKCRHFPPIFFGSERCFLTARTIARLVDRKLLQESYSSGGHTFDEHEEHSR